MQGLREGDVASVGERRDDESGRVAQILVRVDELSVANVGVTIHFRVVPAMAQLRLPQERQRALHLRMQMTRDGGEGFRIERRSRRRTTTRRWTRRTRQ